MIFNLRLPSDKVQVLYINMMKSCAAYGCTNRFSKQGNISFRKFPLNDKNLCQKWIVVTKRIDFVPSKGTVLCSDHFSSTHFNYDDAI